MSLRSWDIRPKTECGDAVAFPIIQKLDYHLRPPNPREGLHSSASASPQRGLRRAQQQRRNSETGWLQASQWHSRKDILKRWPW